MGVPLDSLGFEPELQALYVAVNSVKSAQKRKRSSDSSCVADDISVPEHQAADHQQTNDVHTGLGAPLASQHNDVKRASGKTQEAESEQTVPLTPAAVGSEERSTSRPKKKKAVGLFR